jgi:hypothetical protein
MEFFRARSNPHARKFNPKQRVGPQLDQPASGAAGYAPRAKTTLFAGGNKADVRKMAAGPFFQ